MANISISVEDDFGEVSLHPSHGSKPNWKTSQKAYSTNNLLLQTTGLDVFQPESNPPSPTDSYSSWSGASDSEASLQTPLSPPRPRQSLPKSSTQAKENKRPDTSKAKKSGSGTTSQYDLRRTKSDLGQSNAPDRAAPERQSRDRNAKPKPEPYSKTHLDVRDGLPSPSSSRSSSVSSVSSARSRYSASSGKTEGKIVDASRYADDYQLAAEDIAPDVKGTQAAQEMMDDLKAMQNTFDEWDGVIRVTRKSANIEALEVVKTVDLLRNETTRAREVLENIIQGRSTFAAVMVDVLSHASNSICPRILDHHDRAKCEEIERLTSEISTHSIILNENMKQIEIQVQTLQSGIEALEQSRRNREQESLALFIVRWLNRAFEFLAKILCIAAPILGFISAVGPIALGAVAGTVAVATIGSKLTRHYEKKMTRRSDLEILLQTRIRSEIPMVYSRLKAFPTYQNLLLAQLAAQSQKVVRMKDNTEYRKAKDAWIEEVASLKDLVKTE
ncbi:hypothetical protein SISNIDRAFT_174103 [Sistotremastrum niveocremeum HHB9708]|uniref:Uncharacterized protein n=1 Tax=Sistotremastrum niveocremeum HHB9708 TaxID=1314777 RepID=A0A164RW71_9AGAM|nr:hypothetical protein SISNIDRAFT_174103 [Sistotremastrum niveocremeum HHB9708]